MNIFKDIVWNDVDWPLVHERVRKSQRRIYEARVVNNCRKLHLLQKVLISSTDAKLVAVHFVTTLQDTGYKTPQVDKQVGVTHQEKIELVRSISLNGKAQPIRKVWSPKPGERERTTFGIPTIRDRAKQVLAKLALEPEWEAIFEANSYGFRGGRSSHDAIEAIFKRLSHNKPKWVFHADIRECFNKIDHTSLLSKVNTFPMMKAQISSWLRSGVMEGYAHASDLQVPSTSNVIPEHGIIAPLLVNIALHGVENHLKDYVGSKELADEFRNKRSVSKHPRKQTKFVLSDIAVIRYAHNFVILHEDHDILKRCIHATSSFLIPMGLQINQERYKVKDCTQGFYFLGFQIIQTFVPARDAYKVKITPSKVEQALLLLKIRNIIQESKGCSSYHLISRLLPIIRGWGNYFRFCESQDAFEKMDFYIFSKIRAWAFRRDCKHGRNTIKEKYFPSGKEFVFETRRYRNNWILCGSSKDGKASLSENYLILLSWISKRKFVKVKQTLSPFDGNYVYWARRYREYSRNPNILLNR